MNNALVISGGGSKGAFSSGFESVDRKEYDLYVGTSVGALDIIMFAQGKHKEAVKLHSEFKNSNIYDKDPFNKKGNIKKSKIVVDFVKGKSSFSVTNKLLGVIRDNYSKEAHRRLKKTKKLVVIVSDMNYSEPVYISNKDYNWEEFTFWVWVSTLAYPFAETVIVNGTEYADGGFTVYLGVGYACKRCKNVRAIVLNQERRYKDFKNDNVVEGLLSILDVSMTANLKKDIAYGWHFIKKHNVNLEFVFMPRVITDQPMLFIPKEQVEMVEMGKKLANHTYFDKFKNDYE